MASIRTVAATDAYALRRSVLRGDPHADVHYPQDDDPDAFTLGAFEGEALIGVASFSPVPTAMRPGVHAWQLRGMAIVDAHQRQGLGTLLLGAATTELRRRGAAVLWCNARDTALDFYRRLGFEVEGEGFVTPDSGRPHHAMVSDLG